MNPNIKWYQNNDKVFITIKMSTINNITEKDCAILLNNNKLFFKYDTYKFEQELFDRADKYIIKISQNHILIIVDKIKLNSWDYLFKNKKYNKQCVGIDWNNWIDDTSSSEDNTNVSESPANMDNNFNMDQLQEMMQQYQLNQSNDNVENNDNLDNIS